MLQIGYTECYLEYTMKGSDVSVYLESCIIGHGMHKEFSC